MEASLIARINALTALSRQRELTAEEQEERARLRKQYLEEFRLQMRQQLDQIEFVEEDTHETN